jgi:hypothetical protein
MNGKTVALYLLPAGMLSLTAPAFADETQPPSAAPAPSVGEIVVTAQKRSDPSTMWAWRSRPCRGWNWRRKA